MAYIKVNTQNILEYQQIIETSKMRLENIHNDLIRINARDAISGNTSEYITRVLDNNIQLMSRMQTFLGDAVSKYDIMYNKYVLPEPTKVEPVVVISKNNESNNNGDYGIVDTIIKGTIEKKLRKIGKNISEIADEIEIIQDGKYTYVKGYQNTKFNKWYKKFNGGTGLSGKYVTETIDDFPITKTTKFFKTVGKIFDIASSGIELYENTKNGLELLESIENDNTIDPEEKAEVLATAGVINTIATVVDVAAPYVATAIGKTAGVATCAFVSVIATPAVGVAAGIVVDVATSLVVEGALDFATDVIATKEVVEQVHSSVTNITDSVQEGVQTIADSAKKVANSSSVGEAVNNVVDLAADAAKTVIDVGATVVKEQLKTGGEVVKSAWKKVTSWFS